MTRRSGRHHRAPRAFDVCKLRVGSEHVVIVVVVVEIPRQALEEATRLGQNVAVAMSLSLPRKWKEKRMDLVFNQRVLLFSPLKWAGIENRSLSVCMRKTI